MTRILTNRRRAHRAPGRNEPCPCGSGLKFKRCHGRPEGQGPQAASSAAQIPPEIQAGIERLRREQEAQELIRVRQQGYGRPIITWVQGAYRLIAVKDRIFWGLGWRFFTDFLLFYIKGALGREWGAKALAEGPQHPVFRWFDMFQRKAGLEGRDPTAGVQQLGYMSSLLQLSYALYLIAHHDEIPKSLISRLRRHQPELFRPAVYEAMVAAAFALAGFEIRGAELVQSDRKAPEFWAKSKSGKRYAVEAKCKLAWKSPCDPADPAFQNELRAWVRDKIHSASRKRLHNAVYWLELSIPSEFTPEKYLAVRDLVVATLREADTMTIDGQAAVPAHVFVTNHPHMVMDMIPNAPFWAMLDGYRMEDLSAARTITLEEAFDIRDGHREIHRVFECLTEVHRVPATFDPYPAELMTASGEPVATMRIGERLEIDFPDGRVLAGTLREIAVVDAVAWVVIEDSDGAYQTATMPLSEQEAAAARQYGGAVFGKPEGPPHVHNNVIEFYDWLLEAYGSYSVEGLLKQIQGHPAINEIAALPRAKMLVRVAREVAKAFHARHLSGKPRKG